MKFSVGDYGLNIILAGSPPPSRGCQANIPVRAVEPTSAAGVGSCGAATQMYNYAWKTEHSWAGTSRTFEMTLNDGSSHQAMFKFVR
jgi:hypothetical protein